MHVHTSAVACAARTDCAGTACIAWIRDQQTTRGVLILMRRIPRPAINGRRLLARLCKTSPSFAPSSSVIVVIYQSIVPLIAPAFPAHWRQLSCFLPVSRGHLDEDSASDRFRACRNLSTFLSFYGISQDCRGIRMTGRWARVWLWELYFEANFCLSFCVSRNKPGILWDLDGFWEASMCRAFLANPGKFRWFLAISWFRMFWKAYALGIFLQEGLVLYIRSSYAGRWHITVWRFASITGNSFFVRRPRSIFLWDSQALLQVRWIAFVMEPNNGSIVSLKTSTPFSAIFSFLNSHSFLLFLHPP